MSKKQVNKKTNDIIKSENIINKNIVTLPGFCVVCWEVAVYYCKDCNLIGYCCLSHMAVDWKNHEELCVVVNRILVNNKGLLYGTPILNGEEWRKARINATVKVARLLKRPLLTQERDLILFPKHCSCYETNISKIQDCKKCHQVWCCRNNCKHLKKSHKEWCSNLLLYSTLIRRQAAGESFLFDMNANIFQTKTLELNPKDNTKIIIKKILEDDQLDDCKTAVISQIASGPLTLLYGIRMSNYKVRKQLVVHLIGAEMHYEGSALQSWEYFFLHFLTNVNILKIIMIGPELNINDIKNETVSLCEECQVKKRKIIMEYQDGLLYHEYTKSNKYTKPDLVCAFNPGLHRYTGYDQKDTWPQTIKEAVSTRWPFMFTAYTAYEAPLDLLRVQECAMVNVILPPSRNPFSSLKPDRNFISDHEVPLIFKNYYLTIVSEVV